jgi:hypothetical protein
MQNMNALPQTNLKEKPLDLLSALTETHEVASIISKMKKKLHAFWQRCESSYLNF